MARITAEDCLARIGYRYELVLLASKRVRQLYRGSEPLVKSKNRQIVTVLREIAAGKVQMTPAGAVIDSSSEEDDELAAFN